MVPALYWDLTLLYCRQVRVALLLHCDQTYQRLQDALDRVGAETTTYRLDQGEFPGESFDRVVVLGGDMGAYQDEEYPWLANEKAWLAGQVEAAVPVLGVCLGSQLLAAALGGRALLAPVPEAGVIELSLTEAADAEPAMAAIGRIVLAFHEDTFELPPEATLLARSGPYPHAFRHGSALAVQFHPDCDAAQARLWAFDGHEILARAGTTPEEFAARAEEFEQILDASSRDFFTTWLETK